MVKNRAVSFCATAFFAASKELRTAGVFVLAFWIQTVFSEKQFYVDPEYLGASEIGSAYAPFKYLDGNAWNAINASLAHENTVVYFASRKALTDQNKIYDKGSDGMPREIDLCHRDPKTANTLSFNGRKYYNSNQAAPRWDVNTGLSRCSVAGFNSQNERHQKYSNIIIEGFTIRKDVDGKAISICGDNWVVTNCDISHGKSVKDGPLFLIVPTADQHFEGSSSYAPDCHNIRIENNVIHDSYGELIYIGGGGCSKSDPTGMAVCQGFLSHTGILIKNNKLFNGGIFGGQGDGIDCKAGIRDLVIGGNEIFNLNSPTARGIVLEGQSTNGPVQDIVIENNHIHHCTHLEDAALTLANSWGTPNGVIIRNNVIESNDAAGIKVYDGQSIKIVGNTIVSNRSFGIVVSSGPVEIRNNLLIENNNKSAQVFLCGACKNSNNGFSNTWGKGACAHCVPECSMPDFADAQKSRFWLKPNAPEVRKGIAVAEDSLDILGNKRKPPVGIGAYESR